MKFILNCSCIYSTIWMHHMDINEMQRAKARWELYKNAVYCLELILEATPNKTLAVWVMGSHLTNHSNKTNKTIWDQEKLR